MYLEFEMLGPVVLARNHNKLTFHDFYNILADNPAIHLEFTELFK